MAKRKVTRTAKRKTKRSRKEHARQQKVQLSGLYSLPDNLIEEILLWIRPKDNDKAIWKWVCQMSATCVVFRRIICSEGTPLSPRILNLDLNDRLTVNAMLTITSRFDWMGANIQSVVTSFGFGYTGQVTAGALRSLLTTSGKLPNLKEVHLDDQPFSQPPFINDKLFFRKLTEEHPGLTTLVLGYGVFGKREHYLSPRVFARLAASLPNLKKFGLTENNWMEGNHLVAFFANVGSNLTSLHLCGAGGQAFMDKKALESIATHCHNLVTLQFIVGIIRSRPFANILRSNRNLLHLDVHNTDCHMMDNGRLIFDSIAEHIPRLESFDGSECRWVNDDGIMSLINGQINAFGRVFLTKLHVEGSEGVSVDGLRSFLTRWREASPVLPLEVRTAWYEESDQEAMVTLANDFPEVSFRHG